MTPDAVKPIAESLKNVTADKPHSEEEFAKLAREIDRRAIPWNSLGVIRKERRKRTATLSMK